MVNQNWFVINDTELNKKIMKSFPKCMFSFKEKHLNSSWEEQLVGQGVIIWIKNTAVLFVIHDDVIKWKHFPRYWPFVRGIPGEFPAQRPVMQRFDVFFDLRLNKRLNKQSLGWWFETLSAHYDVTLMIQNYSSMAMLLLWYAIISRLVWSL